MKLKSIIFSILVGLSPTIAEAFPSQVQPGSLETSGCSPSTITPCFKPYSASNPVPVDTGASTTSASPGAASTKATTVQGVSGMTPVDANIKQVGGSAIAEGQTTMSQSLPVVLPSDQTVATSVADGANTTIGAKTDAKSASTDATSVTVMQVLKEISAMVQAPPSQAVTNAGTFATQAAESGTWIVTANLQPVTSGGSSTASANITNSATAVDASPGQIYGWYFYNSNSTVCYVQIFDLATGSVSLGSTSPKMSLGIPANGGSNVAFPNGIVFATAISWAATTTRTGSTACTNGVDANAIYK